MNTTAVSDANGAGGGNRKLDIGDTNITVTGTDEFFPGRIDEPFILDWAMGPTHVAKLKARSPRFSTSPRTTSISPTACARSVRAGRKDAVNRVEASDATIVLDNRDGALLPDPIVNLLPNPSFEEDQPEMRPQPWGHEERDTTHVRTGTYACKLEGQRPQRRRT